MKEKRRKKNESAGSYPREMTISFSKVGLIYFSLQLSEALKLKGGDHVEFCQDEDNLTDWFIRKALDKTSIYEWFLVGSNTSNKHPVQRFNSTGFVRAVKDSLGISAVTHLVKFHVTPKSTKVGWHAILTKVLDKDKVLTEIKKLQS